MTSSLSQQIDQLLSDGVTEEGAVDLIMQGSTAAERKAWAREWVQAVATAVARTRARQVERQAARPAPEPKPRPALSGEERRKLAEASERRRQQQRDADQERQVWWDNYWWDKLSGVFDQYRATLKLELTAELLATRIKLGDGTEVTWGTATADQLRQRANMLLGMAAGDMESAAALTVAADMLDQAGVRCLNELQQEAA